jgi:hypothetical protein
MEERASAYQLLFFRTLQIEGVFPDNQTVRVVWVRHTDAEWKPDLSDLPESCRKEKPPLASPEAVSERLAEIPTRFYLASECDRQLLVTAGAKVVAQRQQEIQDFLAGSAPGAGALRKNQAVGSSVESSAREGISQSRINEMVENRGPG